MQMPTGTGKTVVLAEMVKRLRMKDEGLRILIVAHRIELIEQTGEHLERYDIDYGVIAGGKKVKKKQIGVCQPLRNPLFLLLP